jgi:hypothetical protein
MGIGCYYQSSRLTPTAALTLRIRSRVFNSHALRSVSAADNVVPMARTIGFRPSMFCWVRRFEARNR